MEVLICVILKLGSQNMLFSDPDPPMLDLLMGSWEGSLYKGPQETFLESFLDNFLGGGAARAADLITARKTFWGGCASSRLLHGLPAYSFLRQGGHYDAVSETFGFLWRLAQPEIKKNLSFDVMVEWAESAASLGTCLLYTSPSPRDAHESRMPSSA